MRGLRVWRLPGLADEIQDLVDQRRRDAHSGNPHVLCDLVGRLPHGLEDPVRKGDGDSLPSLVGIASRRNADEVADVVRDGRGRTSDPSQPRISATGTVPGPNGSPTTASARPNTGPATMRPLTFVKVSIRWRSQSTSQSEPTPIAP